MIVTCAAESLMKVTLAWNVVQTCLHGRLSGDISPFYFCTLARSQVHTRRCRPVSSLVRSAVRDALELVLKHSYIRLSVFYHLPLLTGDVSKKNEGT